MRKHYKKVNKQTKQTSSKLVFVWSLSLIISLLLLTNVYSSVYAIPQFDPGIVSHDPLEVKQKESKTNFINGFLDFLKIQKSTTLPQNLPNNSPTSPVNPTGYYEPNQNVLNNSSKKAYAEEVEKVVKANCGGVITNKNYNCAYSLKPIMNESAIAELTSSAVIYGSTQCVACGRAMPKALGPAYNGLGNAKEHIGQKVTGYQYFANTPSNYRYLVAGSVGISNQGPYGHIFYITQVDRDSNGAPYQFYTLECSWGPPGAVITKRRPFDFYMSGWQTPLSL